MTTTEQTPFIQTKVGQVRRATKGLSMADRAARDYEMRLQARRYQYYKHHPLPAIRELAFEMSRFNAADEHPPRHQLLGTIDACIKALNGKPVDADRYPLLEYYMTSTRKNFRLPYLVQLVREIEHNQITP